MADPYITSAHAAQIAAAMPSSEIKRRLWMPAGVIDETISRFIANTTVATVSGQVRLNGGAVIRAGVPITGISFFAAAAPVTPTHQWYCLVRESDNAVLAKTANDTSTAWLINTFKPLAFASPYVPTADAAVWLGLVNVAATPVTLAATSFTAGTVHLVEPGPWTCNANSSLTDPASLGATVTPVATPTSTGYGYLY